MPSCRRKDRLRTKSMHSLNSECNPLHVRESLDPAHIVQRELGITILWDPLVTATPTSNKLSFVSELRVSYLLPAPRRLLHINFLACKQGEISVPAKSDLLEE